MNDIDFILEIMINDSDKNELFDLMMEHDFNGFLITNSGLVHENRALTLPNPNHNNRTLWKNHFFTKKSLEEIKEFSINYYGYSI